MNFEEQVNAVLKAHRVTIKDINGKHSEEMLLISEKAVKALIFKARVEEHARIDDELGCYIQDIEIILDNLKKLRRKSQVKKTDGR